MTPRKKLKLEKKIDGKETLHKWLLKPNDPRYIRKKIVEYIEEMLTGI